MRRVRKLKKANDVKTWQKEKADSKTIHPQYLIKNNNNNNM